MKAMYRPPKPSSKYAKDVRRHIQLDVDRYLNAKKQTISDRVCAMVMITLNSEFGFGPQRLRRFWDAFQIEVARQIRNMDDTEDGLLFNDLRRIGLEHMVDVIERDYAAEQETVKGSIFDIGEDSNDGKGISQSGAVDAAADS